MRAAAASRERGAPTRTRFVSLVAVSRGVLGDGVVVDDEQEHDEEAEEALLVLG